jgi:DNA-binding helix-hairpin-helix protein with protein kinase domain
MGASIARLFVRAFAAPGSGGERPDAKAWIDALAALKTNLRACPAASWHHYPAELQSCPWCEIESRTAVRLFGQRIVAHGPTGAIDLATLWNAIAAVADPGADPVLPSDRPWHPPPGIDLPSPVLKYTRIALSLMFALAGVAACSGSADGGFGVIALAWGVALFLWPWVSAEKRAEADRTWSAANAEWENALARWKREASRRTFEEKRKSLEQARAELADLPKERQRRLARLEAERESRQRQRYLDRFRIDRAKIRNIGTGRASMLASYGIETAADVDSEKILKIPGFGPMLTGELVQWRQSHERNFRFNPGEPVDRRDVDAIDREIESRRQVLLSALRQGPDALRRLSQEITAARPRLMPTLENAWTARRIAEIRRNAL